MKESVGARVGGTSRCAELASGAMLWYAEARVYSRPWLSTAEAERFAITDIVI